MCFAFSVSENEEGDKFELELQYNDLWPRDYRAIPSQRRRQWSANSFMPEWDDYELWLNNGFAYLQNWCANAILKRKTGINTASIVTMIVPQRTNAYYQDDLAQIIERVLAFFWLLMYVPALYRTCYRIVDEKECRAKESMFMMGLKPHAYWASWFAYYTIVNLIIATSTWIPLTFYVITASNGLILWLTIFLYGQSLFGLLLITQSLFTRARACAITTTLIYFGAAILVVLVDDDDVLRGEKVAAAILPPIAMTFMVRTIAAFEASSVGLNFQNLF